jgi:hypothetical protein
MSVAAAAPAAPVEADEDYLLEEDEDYDAEEEYDEEEVPAKTRGITAKKSGGLFGCCQGKVKVSGPQAATTTTTTTGDEEEEEEEPDLLDALEDWADEEEE